MEKQKDLQNNLNVNGELTFDDKVVQKIIGIALESIKGLLTVDGGFFSNIAEKLVNTNDPTTGIGVEVGKEQVAVDLNIVAEYGHDIPKMYTEIKSLVAKEVKKMTGLEVIEVNVTVVDVKTKEEYEKDSVNLQDRLAGAAEGAGELMSDTADKAKSLVNQGAESAKEKLEPRVK